MEGNDPFPTMPSSFGTRFGVDSVPVGDRGLGGAFHGANDVVVHVRHTDVMVAAVRALGNKRVRYTRYDWSPAYEKYPEMVGVLCLRLPPNVCEGHSTPHPPTWSYVEL